MHMQIYTYIQADTDTQWIAVHKDEMNQEHLPDDGFLRALISAESEAEKEKKYGYTTQMGQTHTWKIF